MIDLRKSGAFYFPPEGLYLVWLWHCFWGWRWSIKLANAEKKLRNFYQSPKYRTMFYEDVAVVQKGYESRVCAAKKNLGCYERRKAFIAFFLTQRGVESWIGAQ